MSCHGRFRGRPAVLVWLAALALTAPASTGMAQSALERPPNVEGSWVAPRGPIHFHIIHRFDLVGEDVKNLIASPTFLLAAGLPARTLVGGRFASSSDVRPRRPSEWELFARWQPLAEDGPVRGAVQAGRNLTAGSWDGELALSTDIGPVTVLAVGRGFSRPYTERETRFAAGGGVVWRATRFVGLGADAVSLLDREPGERIAWSAGLLLGIPYTPHTLSLHATNVNTGTLQGASRGRGNTRWGFEFTIPITLARIFGRPPPAAVPAADPDADQGPDVRLEASADTVVARIRDFSFEPQRLEVAAGTTVVWVNEGATPHTVTAEDGSWTSPLLEQGESWARVFDDPGQTSFTCTPHPFMQGVLVVTAAGAL